jgi:serine/threonine protein kinase
VVRLLQVLDLVHAAQPPLYLGELRSPDLWATPEGELALAPFVFARPRQSTLSPYCAPELEHSLAQSTPAADLYALAAVMYHLLTGWPPPTAEQRRAGVPLNPPCTLNAQIRPLTEQMLLRALDLTPANRYQHVGELRCAMEVVRVLSAHAPELEHVSAPLTPLPANPPTDPPPVALPANLAVTDDTRQTEKPAVTQRSNTCLLIIVVLLALVALGICVTGIWLLTGPGQELLR